MSPDEIHDKVVAILLKYSRIELPVDQITRRTSITEDLAVNSARLVDIIIDLEDAFDIEILEGQADVDTVGQAVDLIQERMAAAG